MTVEKLAQDSNFAIQVTEESSYGDDGMFYTSDSDLYVEDDEDEAEAYAKDKDKDKDSKSEKDDDDDDDEIVVLEFDDPSESQVVFTMPEVPGAPDAQSLPEPEIEVVDDEDDEPKELDPWDWKSRGHAQFIPWLQGMIQSTPQHSGQDVAGLERASSYLEFLLKEISKAMRSDYKGEIDSNHCEEMRRNMYGAIDRINNRIERLSPQKKKSAWVSGTGLVKEGQKAPNVTGVTITVPLFISRLARVLINGTVSAGHSMEDMYDKLKEEYDLTKREEAELQQLLADMNYPVFQDRGMLNEQVDKSRSDNKDWAANYNG